MPYRKVILMYHSVSGPAAPAVAGSFPVALERLQHHVRAARNRGWQFGRISELHKDVAGDTLYLTSDDGTTDWAANVLPWCETEGIPTHTAIITGPWLDPPVYPVTHRVQILLDQPWCRLPVPVLNAEQRTYVNKVYAYETDPRRRYLKGACNLVLEDRAVQELLGEPDADEALLLARRFAAPAAYFHDLAEVGVHTVRHTAFGGDPQSYYAAEIAPCREALRSAGLQPTRCFTLPMRPRHPATAEQLVPILAAGGFNAMLDSQGEWDGWSFVVPRIDAKNVEAFLGLPAWQPSKACSAT